MGIDMTMLTGWPFGGPNISFEHAAKANVLKELDLETVTNTGDLTKGIKGGILIYSLASKDNNSFEYVAELTQANGRISNTIAYEKTYALIMRSIGKKVARASTGDEGLVRDYLNKNDLDHYLQKFQRVFSCN